MNQILSINRTMWTIPFTALLLVAITTPSQAAVEYLHRQKATIVGHPISIDHVSEVGPDCRTLGMPAVKLASAPSHGTVSTAKAMFFPIYPVQSPRAKCNTIKTSGVVITYRPRAGFTGHDWFEINIAYSDGLVRDTKVDVDIR